MWVPMQGLHCSISAPLHLTEAWPFKDFSRSWSAAAQLLLVAEKLKASQQPGSAEILLYRTHQQLQACGRLSASSIDACVQPILQ